MYEMSSYQNSINFFSPDFGIKSPKTIRSRACTYTAVL